MDDLATPAFTYGHLFFVLACVALIGGTVIYWIDRWSNRL